jgi:hypothetical protein
MTTRRLFLIFGLIDLLGVAAITAAYWWLLTQGI